MTRFLTRCAVVALVLGACVGCDQIAKSAAREYLPGTGVHSYLADTLRLEYAQNPGAFLNLGATLSPAVRYDSLIIGVGVFVLALLLWAVAAARLTWLQRLALAAVGAGGLGNLIDRIRFDGAVTDFLNLGLGPLRTGIFNVADAILTLGAVLLLISLRARQ
ncbi:MAG TPA: signal peptidase II [Steroidobacteraceae bacterium]|jgi:signal peptidase II|nr:signal peptidase II [Steroidobacteraceae bacterium]